MLEEYNPLAALRDKLVSAKFIVLLHCKRSLEPETIVCDKSKWMSPDTIAGRDEKTTQILAWDA